jgi:diguanylate cyclase (GGDEF)-like protein
MLAFLDYFVHPSCFVSTDRCYRGRVLAGVLVIASVILFLYGLYLLIFQPIAPDLVQLGLLFIVLESLYLGALLFLFKYRGFYRFVCHATVLGTVLPIILSIFMTGGPALSPATHDVVIPVLLAFCLGGKRFGLAWAGAVVVVLFGMMLANKLLGFDFVAFSDIAHRDSNVMMNWTLSFVVTVAVLALYETVNLGLREERNAERDKFAYLASHDSLTGLANRAKFDESLQQACLRSDRSGTTVSLLYIDLDAFKPINDRLGHGAGDVVLQTIANRLKDEVRSIDCVARLGGDEFAVIMEGLSTSGDLDKIAQKIEQVVERKIVYRDHDIFVGASVGTAVYPEHADAIPAFVAFADRSMYEAKRTRPAA